MFYPACSLGMKFTTTFNMDVGNNVVESATSELITAVSFAGRTWM